MKYTVHGILQARILELVALPFSRGSSQPRDRTQVSHIAARFFTSWATREAQESWSGLAYPFSSGSSQPRNQTRVSWVAGRFFTKWATREAQLSVLLIKLNSDPRDGIRFHRLKAQPHKAAPSPTPLLQKQVASPSCHLCFWPPGGSPICWHFQWPLPGLS